MVGAENLLVTIVIPARPFPCAVRRRIAPAVFDLTGLVVDQEKFGKPVLNTIMLKKLFEMLEAK